MGSSWSTSVRWSILTGAVLGLGSVLLLRLGNPPNMGICSACFLRDVAGGLQLFSGPAGLQYLRPEVPAFVLGSFVAALAFGELRSRGGSSPVLRFVLGAFVMVGALVFLGCPIRMMLRLAGGDWQTAGVGLLGLLAGVAAGSWLIRRGFSLGSGRDQARPVAMVAPLLALGLAGLVAYLALSGEDPRGLLDTKWHAPILVSFGVALAIGFLAQRSRFCSVAGFRDLVLGERSSFLPGYLALVSAAVIGNLAVDAFFAGSVAQLELGAAPIAHHEHLWNFLGLSQVGLGSILLAGCPLRQMVAAGQGDGDATITVMGLLAGAALCHGFGLTAAPAGPETDGGPAFAGKVAVLVGIAVCAAVGLTCRPGRARGR